MAQINCLAYVYLAGRLTVCRRQHDKKQTDMDDESIRQHLRIDVASNSTPSSDHKNRLSNLVILIVICVVMVCGVTFAAIILERGADLENKVHSQETQLLLVKKLFEKILRRKSNSSFTSRVITDPRIEARKYNGLFGYATKRVWYFFI